MTLIFVIITILLSSLFRGYNLPYFVLRACVCVCVCVFLTRARFVIGPWAV
jgi:hypothetical protein